MNVFQRVRKIKKKEVYRTLPAKGRITVKVGDTVTPSDIIAEVKQSAGFRIINTAMLLNVHPSKASSYITRKVGDHIYKGEIVAERYHMFKRESQKIYAAVDGIIENINKDNGQILTKIAKKQENIPAGVWGTIKTIEDETRIVIETQVVEILCKAGRGYQREGSIKIITSNHEFVHDYMIKEEFAGKVLIGGSGVSRHTLAKAVNLGVEGFVCGGVSFEDIRSIGEKSDIGTTLVVTEGFGTIPMNNEIYSSIQKYDNYYCFIDGRAQTLTIPLESLDDFSEPEIDTKLVVGKTVRITGDHDIGVIGDIQEILPHYKYISGFNVPSVKIQNGNREYIVPQSNVEIII